MIGYLIGLAIFGLVVGALARLALPGKDPMTIPQTMLIGIAGSLIAGLIGRAAGWYATGESAGFIASIIGAMLLLVAYRLVTRLRARA